MAGGNQLNQRQVRISKLSQSKVYDYIRKVEIDGLPRVRAYAESIDSSIYDMEPDQIRKKLDYLKETYPDFELIRESVLAEHKDWALRKSSAIQNKAVDLLSNLLDKANSIATDPNADAKDLNVAVSTLRSIMPAFTAIGATANQDTSTTNKKARAGKFIN